MTKRLGVETAAFLLVSACLFALPVMAGALPVAADPARVDSPQAGAPGTTILATVRLPRAVLADGKRLPAGSYRLRLTEQVAKPDVVGLEPQLTRWVEFLQGGEVRGRELASIVPSDQIGQVADGPRPGPGNARVDVLKGGDYVRVWVNEGGRHYLIHLPPAA